MGVPPNHPSHETMLVLKQPWWLGARTPLRNPHIPIIFRLNPHDRLTLVCYIPLYSIKFHYSPLYSIIFHYIPLYSYIYIYPMIYIYILWYIYIHPLYPISPLNTNIGIPIQPTVAFNGTNLPVARWKIWWWRAASGRWWTWRPLWKMGKWGKIFLPSGKLT